MKIKYYGTAAAEGLPAFFCECEVCQNARKKGGRNVRTRPQALVDGKLLLDLGPDTYMHTIYDDLPLPTIYTCLITHTHGDHIQPANVRFRSTPINATRVTDNNPFHVFGTQKVKDLIWNNTADFAAHMEKTGELIFTTIEPFVTYDKDGYKITPLKATHGAEEAIFYMIQKEDKAMLYAHDTGLFPEETWEFLEKKGVKFDFISLDCTNGLKESKYPGHMGLAQDVIVRDKLKEMGKVDDNTVCVINHFSHNGIVGFDEMVPLAEKEGFIVSYDGMEIEF